MDNKTNLLDKIHFDFEKAINDLDALNNYYIETSKTINQIKFKLEKQYKNGFLLANELDKIFSIPQQERNEFIEKLNEEILFDDCKVSDLINISLNSDYSLSYSMKTQSKALDPNKAKTKLTSIYSYENIFVRSIICNIIIVFEQYFSSQYETLVVSNPECYFEDRQIPVTELFRSSIQKTLSNLISKEVESNMFDSLKTLDKVKTKSKIDIDRYISIRKEFEEIYYRRNVYVHAMGYANKMYIEHVDPKFTGDVKVGDKLVCDDVYLENALLTTYKIICSLYFEMLNNANAKPEDHNELLDIGFEALQNEKYKLAEYIFGLLRHKKDFEFSYRAIYEVDYILALKLMNNDITKNLNEFDVSIATDNFRIAKECLLENFENVYNMLMKTYPNSFCAQQIREWPIFLGFRKSEYYTKFLDMHKKDFEVFVFEGEKQEESQLLLE